LYSEDKRFVECEIDGDAADGEIKITVHFEDVPTSTGTNFPTDRESIG